MEAGGEAAAHALLDNADHIDVKVVEGEVSLREFIAAVSAYQPGWMAFLYRVRRFLVRLLGMRQEGVPRPLQLRPEEVPMRAGDTLGFFTVCMAKENLYWVGEASDKHLRGILGVAIEPLAGRRKRFHVFTVVHYRNWAGPVYFNLIRPFHHLVVWSMARAAVRAPAH